MSQTPSSERPSGYLLTILGGLAGATVGILIGIPVARANSEGGLEAIGTGLAIVFVLLCLGTALGAGVALAIGGQERPLFTGLLVLPGMFVAVFVELVVFARLEIHAIYLLAGVAAVTVAVLWLVRAVAVLTMRTGPSGVVRED